MNRTPVASSNLHSVGYDPTSQTLEIEFHGGEIYHYFGVPEAVHKTLMAADSHGEYFQNHIREVYSYEQVS